MIYRYCTLLSLVLLFLGCNRQSLPPDLPKCYPATLTFTQNGAPVADAIVQMLPETGAPGQWIPGGITDSSGNAMIRVNGQYNGAPIGKYVVTVIKAIREPSKLAQPADPNSPEYEQWEIALTKENLATRRYVDKKYEDKTKSDLRIEIGTGKNSQSFDLGTPIDEIVK